MKLSDFPKLACSSSTIFGESALCCCDRTNPGTARTPTIVQIARRNDDVPNMTPPVALMICRSQWSTAGDRRNFGVCLHYVSKLGRAETAESFDPASAKWRLV